MKIITVLALAVLSCSPAIAAPVADASEQGSQALRAVLQDVVRAGPRLVAVGERGVVLLSDDNGQHWRQGAVPVRNTLTATDFVNDTTGWAIGHGGVVLHSSDGGENWKIQWDGQRLAEEELKQASISGDEKRVAHAKQLVADGADKPFLDIQFEDSSNGIVVGAYGIAMATTDGGRNWHSIMGLLPNPEGLHLYAIARRGDLIVIAGERGLLLRSRDGGKSFESVDSPYQGSFFTAAYLSDGRILLGGLRGNLFSSVDQASSFTALPSLAPVSYTTIREVGGRVLMINQAGLLTQSRTENFDPQIVQTPPGNPLFSVTEAADGHLVGVGLVGAVRLDSNTSTPALRTEP